MSKLLGKRVRNEQGGLGEIVAVSSNETEVAVRFYDGEYADPTDPTFPMYELVIRVSDLEFMLEPEDNADAAGGGE